MSNQVTTDTELLSIRNDAHQWWCKLNSVRTQAKKGQVEDTTGGGGGGRSTAAGPVPLQQSATKPPQPQPQLRQQRTQPPQSAPAASAGVAAPPQPLTGAPRALRLSQLTAADPPALSSEAQALCPLDGTATLAAALLPGWAVEASYRGGAAIGSALAAVRQAALPVAAEVLAAAVATSSEVSPDARRALAESLLSEWPQDPFDQTLAAEAQRVRPGPEIVPPLPSLPAKLRPRLASCPPVSWTSKTPGSAVRRSDERCRASSTFRLGSPVSPQLQAYTRVCSGWRPDGGSDGHVHHRGFFLLLDRLQYHLRCLAQTLAEQKQPQEQLSQQVLRLLEDPQLAEQVPPSVLNAAQPPLQQQPPLRRPALPAETHRPSLAVAAVSAAPAAAVAVASAVAPSSAAVTVDAEAALTGGGKKRQRQELGSCAGREECDADAGAGTSGGPQRAQKRPRCPNPPEAQLQGSSDTSEENMAPADELAARAAAAADRGDGGAHSSPDRASAVGGSSPEAGSAAPAGSTGRNARGRGSGRLGASAEAAAPAAAPADGAPEATASGGPAAATAAALPVPSAALALPPHLAKPPSDVIDLTYLSD